MSTSYPDRLSLAQLPTPLEPLPRYSSEVNVELLTKRDDLTGLGLSGNKVRKLEFLLADAEKRGADTIITGGGEQSNHCRATAVACARLNLSAHLALRTQTPDAPPAATGNILLSTLSGATIQWINHDQWEQRDKLFEDIASGYRKEGKTPYVIPEGGSNALGAWGYVRAMGELAMQLANRPAKDTTIIYACGSGGTGAGLLLGKSLFNMQVRVIGVNVCNDAEYFRRGIHDICEDFRKTYLEKHRPTDPIQPEDVEILDGYVGPGYAQTTPEQHETIAAAARKEGIFLDPVYSGKAFHALCAELDRAPGSLGERIIFLHTGGAFGLFAG